MLNGHTNSGCTLTQQLFAVLFSVSMLLLVACGQGASSTQQPEGGSADQRANEFSVLVDGEELAEGDEEDPQLALAPVVNAGPDQFADANVVVALTGTATAQGDAEISSVQWRQLSGPAVAIPRINELSNIINVPDTTEPDLLVFALQATDSEGRSSEDVIVINVLPLEVFARVISTSVAENEGQAVVRVELNRPSEDDTFLSYRSIDGSAESGSDYFALAEDIVIPAGETSAQVTIDIIDDFIQEADETLLVQIAVESGEVRNTGTGTVIIRNGDDVADQLVAQTIAFAQPGPLQGNVGSAIVNVIEDNPQAAPGSGAVTYRSSNPLVATVDTISGEATLLAPGATVITAFKAADNIYASTQTSYNLTVSLLAQEINFAEPGPLSGLVNDTLNNPIDNTGSGTGEIVIVSSNPELATVDSDSGEVTLLAGGTVLITATKAADELYAAATATYTINVGLLPQELVFTQPGPVLLLPGQSLVNTVQETPGTGRVVYASADPLVVAVDEATGEAEALARGSTTITALKAADGIYAEATASYTVNVSLQEQTISFTDSVITVSVGDVVTNPLLDSGEGTGPVTYTSADPGIAEVDADSGQVTLTGTGTVVITAVKAADSAFAEAQASYNVVVGLSMQSLSFEQPSISAGIGEQFINPLTEAGSGSGEITFSSTDTRVATVDEETGQVSPLTVGSTVITAIKAADSVFSEASASYTVTVTDPNQTLRFELSQDIVFIGDIFTNPLIDSGQGNGAITYQSSDTNVASVGITSGVVVTSQLGSAVITATKAADGVFEEATASFRVDVILRPQELSFEVPGPVLVEFGTSTFANPLVETGEGTGAITIASSDESVGFYDDGEVVITGAGTTLITATKAADDLYRETSVSFTLSVLTAR